MRTAFFFIYIDFTFLILYNIFRIVKKRTLNYETIYHTTYSQYDRKNSCAFAVTSRNRKSGANALRLFRKRQQRVRLRQRRQCVGQRTYRW